MFDSALRQIIDPPLNAIGRELAHRGVTPNLVTLTGLACGIGAMAAIASDTMRAGLILIVASRLCDGLDGAIARATRPTDTGGYLDITCDFLFYGLIPLGFVILDPQANGLAGAVLLTSFYFNGTSFLGYAILAERRGVSTQAQGIKSLYYSNGLLEGGETIAFFIALCIWPDSFVILSLAFAILCFATGVLRIVGAFRRFVPSD